MPLTVDLPDHPFTYQDLNGLGMSRRFLRQQLAAGAVRRVVRGVYVPTAVPDTVQLRAQSIARVIAASQVIRDRTAAWIHGVDSFTYAEHEVAPPIETCALRGNPPSVMQGVAGRTRDLQDEDVMAIGRVRVTTPLRTALDLGCLLRRREALATLDAFGRIHGLTPPVLDAESDRFRRRRGVVQLRELIPLLDPRAESARESWTRLAILDAGLPAPVPQWWIDVDGIPTYRLDLAYPYYRVAVEYDGFDTHERTAEQRAHDHRRREWLRRNGWVVIVIRRGDFTGDNLDRWLRQLANALRPSYSNVRQLERNARLG